MDGILAVKTHILTIVSIIGACVSMAFGGWDSSLSTLIMFMAIDYATGFIAAAFFQSSLKSENGGLESRAGFKGICRKGVALLIVLIGCRLDLMMDTNFIRDAVIIGFVVNECVSIIENAALMGIPVPKAIKNAIDILRNDNKEENEVRE